MVSKIKPDDTALNYVAFRLSDFLELGALKEKTLQGGSARSYLKDTLKALRDKSFYITREDGKEVLCAWIHKVILDYDENTIMLRLDEDLMPLLVGLGKNFTKYPVYYILEMKSGYSIRLYELLKSEEWLKKPILYKTEEIKQKIGADTVKSYGNSSKFIEKCIDPAIKEINELTDIKVRCKIIKGETRGNPITHLQFIIKSKQGAELDTARQANEDKRGGQVHMETPMTNAEAFPIAELAENTEELKVPEKKEDCRTYEQLEAWRVKYQPTHHPYWVNRQAEDNTDEGNFDEPLRFRRGKNQ
jgi:plasmid replication initiation protein